MFKKVCALVTGLFAALLLHVPAMAAVIPRTGDLRGQLIWIVLGVGVVALVVVIIMTAMGGKGKKKKK